MRITESRLRRVIRQVIREGFGDGDMTPESSLERNRRIEQQAFYNSPNQKKMRMGQERARKRDHLKRQKEYRKAVVNILVECSLPEVRESLENYNFNANHPHHKSIDTSTYKVHAQLTTQDRPVGIIDNLAYGVADCFGLLEEFLNDDDVNSQFYDAVDCAVKNADKHHGINCLFSAEPYGDIKLDKELFLQYLCDEKSTMSFA